MESEGSPLAPRSHAAESDESTTVLDPRAWDLHDDSQLWTVLLTCAYALDGAASDGAFGTLHGLRCLGATLVHRQSGIGIRRGRIPPAEYGELRRRYLIPRALVIRRLLKQLDATRAVETAAIA